MLEIVGSQAVARQCLVAAIQHRPEVETSATADNELLQLKPPALCLDVPANEAECEDLERVTVPGNQKTCKLF